MTNLKRLLELERVGIINSGDHKDVVNRLLDMVKDSPRVTDFEKLKESIWERERLVSTGIGLGLAIPHVRNDRVKDFIVSALIIEEGTEWKALDDKPIHFAILIASPKDTHKEYLKILAEAVLMWKNGTNREKVLKAKSEEELHKLLLSLN